jgi:ribosomal protein S18 acetylase RimI-like enzyme
MPELAKVRRFEAAGFRAWPAGTTHYDGTWLLRLTAGYPAKRLNSVNPLDPSDLTNLHERIGEAGRRFDEFGRPLIFRMSPLSGRPLEAHLDSLGWARFDESRVMRLPLDGAAVDDAMDQIPLKDVARFIGAALDVHGYDAALRQGLADVVAAIQPEAGLFVLEQDEHPMATAICVHDGDLAGLFEIATSAAERGKGYGRRIVLSALKWARLRGATEAWLQVGADNQPAVKLYEAIGFTEVYRYHYRRPPEA